MNTITLPVSELKSALHGLGKIISRKTSLPVLQHVKITKNDGKVTLQATNLDAFVTYSLTDTQPGKSMEVLIPFEQLNKAYKSSKKEDLAILCDGKNTRLRYNIAGNPIEQPINAASTSEFPPVPQITAESTKLDSGFGEALRQAMECCSADPSRLVLNGACLDAREPKAHYIVGTNGRFLYSANTFHFGFKDDIIIPNSRFITGSELLNSECSLAIQPGKKPEDTKHICLKNERWEFIVREVEGNFPNWKQVVPTVKGDWIKVQLQPSAVSQLLQVIPNLPGRDGDTNTIRLRIEKQLYVEGKGKEDADWTTINIPDVEITGKAKIICLNRDYLLPALKFGLTELAVVDELSPMIARKEGRQMVIMPVRPPAIATVEKPSNPATPAAISTPTSAERKDMPRTARIQTPTVPTEVSETPAQTNSIEEAATFLDQMRETLKEVLVNLNSIAVTLKKAEKEKKAGDKEVEMVRSKLRQIQSVKI